MQKTNGKDSFEKRSHAMYAKELPDFITGRFKIETLLHESERTRVYRMQESSTGKKYVLKVRRAVEKAQLEREEQVLRMLAAGGVHTPWRPDKDRLFLAE